MLAPPPALRRAVVALLLAGVAACGPGRDAAPPPPDDAGSSATPDPSASSRSPGEGATDAQGGTDPTGPVELADVVLAYEVLAEGFDAPVLALPRPGTAELWVLEQGGDVVAVGPDGERRTVLRLGDRVASGGERGLLGLAFVPDHGTSGRFVLHYSRAGDGATRIETWLVDEAGVASPERIVLEVDQPAGNHNGGMVAFGPDGRLWIGLGDGGAADDRFGNGQRPDTLLGAILRLDLEPAPYGIPSDNPFVDGADPDGDPAAPEVWAYGLRNPWRFWIDQPSGQLVVGDVGQNRVEEVDAIALDRGGANLGWPIREGSTCFEAPGCRSDGLVAPIAEYTHDEGCSITGGVVVRGGGLAALDGHFLFSDFCSGFLRTVGVDGPARGVVRDWTDQVGALDRVTSFGLDVDGAPLVLTADGVIRRIVDAS